MWTSVPKTWANCSSERPFRLRHEDHKGALSELNRAVQLSPDLPDLIYDRAKLHEELENHSEAIADLNRAAELNPRDARIYSLRAKILGELERTVEAQADLD